MTDSIASRLAAIQERVRAAAKAAGRAPEDVILIAVSKRHSDTKVDAVIASGHLHFGENLVQPWAERVQQYPSAHWHLIGPVQSKKAKQVWQHRPVLLHTVDRDKLVTALERRQELEPGAPLPCLIEVNVEAEPQKAGVFPDALDALVDRVTASPALELRGLMCIPRPEPSGAPFARLRELAESVGDRLPERYELSMGMSGDFELAIQEGATLVRVGTAIFGARAY